ncbi:substrate-binding domain-containing protein [Bdellovibrio reynosensis]|uniref:Phosphate/phosphite/phosphonate ABC transporter substrate-binding protein n=1 Tax=Bdellovibrio reynosensis TaxID=2835041 RepID=A0ABY4CEQ4_9BACT|nr:phosphate/phosphite/phosphonate ABC transporter substrate-binding protein [Bdellovibrio reynosensis]UOF02939.1 phosphate/phosphite/phosphonate ABC transporter substrate-binding protein [Bdellovibrio reynosensis]
MKRLILGLITLLVFSPVFAENTPAEEAPPAITIGVIPGGNPENVREQGLTLAKELQTRLNIPVNIYISKNYSGLIEAMKTKKVDFAFFSSATYVLAEEQAKAKVLLKKSWHEPYYYSMVITPLRSGIKNLKQLKGKRMAFVDDKSSSGYLYPWAEFKKLGFSEKDFKEMVFTGNHQASIQFLEAKKVDAAAVFSDDDKGEQGAWKKFGTDKKAKYRIIWQSPPIPNDPFAVRQDFYDLYPKTTHSLMFALIDLVQENRGKDTYTEILGSRDLMPATSKQYDPVREMVKALGLKP